MTNRRLARGLLWGLLAVVLAAVVTVALWRKTTRAAPVPPPKLSYLPGFVLTNHDGREVTLADLSTAPWVADFIFTRCPGPCLKMSQEMAALGRALPPEVRRVSFTVDPDYDTPQVLAEYAARFRAADDWLFLTGSREAIWELSADGFKLAVAPATDEAPPEAAANEQGPIVHSTRFVLVDRDGAIRGYYDAFEPLEVHRLLADLQAVLAER